MDLAHLRHFHAVAREGGFSAAARALGVAQSTLSEAVRRLEEQLGSTLLLRTRTGVVPTDAGQLLLDRADDLFGLVQRVADEIRDVERGDRGRFVIGCHDQLGSYFFPTFLDGFLREHAGIEIELFCASSADVRQAVVDREVHIGLVVNTVSHPDLVIVDAFRDEVRLFGAGPPCTTLAEARRRVGESILAIPGRAPFEGLAEQLLHAGVSPRQVLVTGDLGLARALAASGTALALLPWRVATDRPGLTVVHEDLPHHDDRVDVVWRGDAPRTRAARRVRAAVLDAARGLPPLPALARAA
ncbi:MAG: LysR family transcriptional regulator [Myxococcota bacterium]